MVTSSGSTAVLWGTEGSPFSVGYDEPMWAGDSGLSVLLTDAPDPSEVEPGDPRVGVVHVSCLVDDHPELERAFAIAREYGVADLDEDGVWVVGDLSRLAEVN